MHQTTRLPARRSSSAWTFFERLFAAGRHCGRPHSRGTTLALEELEARLVPSTFTYRQGENGYAGAVSGAISSLGGGNGTTFRDGVVDWCMGVLPSENYSESPLLRFENLGIPA